MLFCLLFPSLGTTAAPPVSIGLGFEFTSGDYGTSTRTDAVYAPLTIGYTPGERWDFFLEVPYVYQSNTNVIAGQFRQMRSGQTTMAKTAPAMGGSGMGGSAVSSSSNTDPSRSRSGLGDITLKTGYILIHEGNLWPRVRPNISVKFPTADKDDGLGTGEFDEALAVEFTKWFGNWLVFVEPGYTIQGKSADIPLKNYVSCNGGFGYQVTDNLRPLFILKGSTPLAEDETGLFEARLKLRYQITGHTGMEGYVAKGLSTSSPEYGSGVALFYDF